MQPTGALQYLKFSTPYLALTWQSKAQSYVTPVLMDMFHRAHLLWLPVATESTGRQLNYLTVKVLLFLFFEIRKHIHERKKCDHNDIASNPLKRMREFSDIKLIEKAGSSL